MKPLFDASKNIATAEQAFDAVLLATRLAEQMDPAKMKSSAVHCAELASKFAIEGRFGYAHEWACESLAYSVGILHPDYRRLMTERR